jgi:hypothetical protein
VAEDLGDARGRAELRREVHRLLAVRGGEALRYTGIGQYPHDAFHARHGAGTFRRASHDVLCDIGETAGVGRRERTEERDVVTATVPSGLVREARAADVAEERGVIDSRRSSGDAPIDPAIRVATIAARDAVSGATPAAVSVASERLATISASR